ncbi:MAG TPA: GNAT family N-acetyltransferase [Microbacteriaceae bacterium]|nr:GNAT family N-acetyltransferase [Microbacteriaceae bacterium]
MLESEYQRRRVLPHHLRKPVEPERAFSFVIRDARASDLPEVREMYNYYVANSSVTFDSRAMSHSDWAHKFGVLQKFRMPFLVAEAPTGQILGYALAAPIQERRSARVVAENSIYLGPAATGKGLGTALMAALIEKSRALGLRELVAIIADKNAEGSLRLHEQFGFVESGRMGRVGFKFGRHLGSIMMRKSLKRG